MLTLLLALGLYHRHLFRSLALDYPTCAANPSPCDGGTLFVELQPITALHPPDRYDLGTIPIEGPTDGLHPSELLSVRGRFRASDATLVEEARSVHPHRAAKERLSLTGAVLALLVAPLGHGEIGLLHTEASVAVAPALVVAAAAVGWWRWGRRSER